MSRPYVHVVPLFSNGDFVADLLDYLDYMDRVDGVNQPLTETRSIMSDIHAALEGGGVDNPIDLTSDGEDDSS